MYKRNEIEHLSESEVWDILENYSIATDDELSLITDINGYSIETLESVIYAREGLNTVEQLLEYLDLIEEDDEEEENEEA